jgi:hypothetical protein
MKKKPDIWDRELRIIFTQWELEAFGSESNERYKSTFHIEPRKFLGVGPHSKYNMNITTFRPGLFVGAAGVLVRKYNDIIKEQYDIDKIQIWEAANRFDLAIYDKSYQNAVRKSRSDVKDNIKDELDKMNELIDKMSNE